MFYFGALAFLKDKVGCCTHFFTPSALDKRGGEQLLATLASDEVC